MILGAYRIEGLIGAGSMGEVYKAIDTGLDRPVAIKLLVEKHRDNPELRQRFVREGRAVAAISHPNVVQVFATGTFDDRPYIAMELLDGTDLGSEVERQGPLQPADAAHVIMDAAQGLSAAARAGLIHRDVKPSNLVRISTGGVKVTDFGLAKPVEAGGGPALTAMGVVVGTPDFIAPEQARGDAIDERVDIYALGGTLYYLLTGSPPFRTGRPADDKYLKVVSRHLRSPAPNARDRNPACDPALARLATAMMAKAADERPTYPQIIAEVADVIARSDSVGAPSARSTPSGGQSRLESTPGTGSASGKRAQSHPAAAPASTGASVSFELSAPPDLPSESFGDLAFAKPRVPRWLIAFSLACAALFLVGLVVLLSRSDARPSPGADPPAGMVLIRRSDGSPWFYVDKRPVTERAYAQVFGDHPQSGDPEGAVVLVSYDGARSFARTRAGRLLRNEEWDAATATPGVVVSDRNFEWVESPEGSRTIRQRGKTEVRDSGAGQGDVTFRVARDFVNLGPVHE